MEADAAAIEQLSARFDSIAKRFDAFAHRVENSKAGEWRLWGMESDNLQIEAGRVLVDAMDMGLFDGSNSRFSRIVMDAKIHGRDFPGPFAYVFDEAMRQWAADLEDRKTAYALHSQTADLPLQLKHDLDRLQFAELQNQRAEGVRRFQASIKRQQPKPQLGDRPLSDEASGMSTHKKRAARNQKITPLHPNEERILNVLKDSISTMTQYDLVEKTELSRRTISTLLASLRRRGLVLRPKGERGGEAITTKGRALIAH